MKMKIYDTTAMEPTFSSCLLPKPLRHRVKLLSQVSDLSIKLKFDSLLLSSLSLFEIPNLFLKSLIFESRELT